LSSAYFKPSPVNDGRADGLSRLASIQQGLLPPGNRNLAPSYALLEMQRFHDGRAPLDVDESAPLCSVPELWILDRPGRHAAIFSQGYRERRARGQDQGIVHALTVRGRG
jgi:hypothetical protein